jgi:hypothetical protein
VVKNDDTPDNKKFLDIILYGRIYYFVNRKLIESTIDFIWKMSIMFILQTEEKSVIWMIMYCSIPSHF